MRVTPLLMAAALAACAIPLAGASALPWGRATIHPPASLGPIGDGRRTWLKYNCYGCHGNNASGGMGPNIQGADGGDVTAAVLQGDALEGGMRSFKGLLTTTDTKNITAYLHSIGTKSEPTWLDWWNTNP